MLELKAGTPLVGLIEARREGGEAIRMATSYEEPCEDGDFLITAPLVKSAIFPLTPGQELDLQYYEKNAIFTIPSQAVERVKRGEFLYVKMRQTGEIRRTQRREDFRLDYAVEGVVEKHLKDKPKPQGYPIRTRDISAGGLLFRSGARFERGEHSTVHFPLDGQMLQLPVEVCRCVRVDDAPPVYRYETGVKFLHRFESEKEKLVAVIFRMQRERRRTL